MRPLNTFSLFFLAVVAMQVLPGKSIAQDGGYPGAYLRIGAGVRAMGAGGAFVALANDVTAGYWNPAGLGELTGPQLSGMYSVLSLDRQYNYVAAAYPFGMAGTIGVSWISYRVGDIEARNQFGVVTGKFGNDENALLFSYGNQVLDNFAVGGSIKLLFHNLAGAGATGMGFDLGAKYQPLEFLAVGASVQNLQTRISWQTAGKTRETFPVLGRAGVNLKPLSFMNITADYEISEQQEGKWHAGWEILLGRMLGLRAGNDHGAVTLGASLMRLAVGNNSFEVDYGFANDAIDQSASHRLAFLLKFGNQEPEIAQSNQGGKKGKQALKEKNLAAVVEERSGEEEGLTVEKSAADELATAEPSSEESQRSTFEKILAGEESEGTMAELAPAEQSQGATITKDGLIVEKVMPENEQNEATAQIRRENESAAAEKTFDEKMAMLDAQARAEEKISAESAADEEAGATPSQMVTYEKDGLLVSKTAPHDEMATTTPPITYGDKTGLTIPEIVPGRRIGHSLTALFQAQIIEARPTYWIINLGEREGFNADMMIEIHQATPDNETGRSYGVALPVAVRSHYSIIKLTDRRSKDGPVAGEKILLKYLYPVVNY